MSNNPFNLDHATAVVTGGYGQIGGAIVRSLINAGASVAILDIAEPPGSNAAKTVRFRYCDTSRIGEIPETVLAIEEELSGFDIWINAAYPKTEDWGTSVGEDSVESWRRNVDLHMNSYCIFAEHAARSMAGRSGGSIINIASIYGVVGPDYHIYEGTNLTTPAAYAAIKGGVIAHTRLLASRYGKHGVRVNAISPGGVFTNQDERFVEAYSHKTALGRMAHADEIGPPVVFLASAASSYVTGSLIMVDGGWTAI